MRYPAVVLIAGLSFAAVSEAEPAPWATSGDWAILVDVENGNGSLMRKDFEDGVRIEFGFVPLRNGGFFAAYSKEWSQIESGTSGIVKFITDKAKFAGDVDMVAKGDWYGGWAFFNNPELVVELAQRRNLTVIGPKGGTFDVDLDGTAKAIALVKDCQSAQG